MRLLSFFTNLPGRLLSLVPLGAFYLVASPPELNTPLAFSDYTQQIFLFVMVIAIWAFTRSQMLDWYMPKRKSPKNAKASRDFFKGVFIFLLAVSLLVCLHLFRLHHSEQAFIFLLVAICTGGVLSGAMRVEKTALIVPAAWLYRSSTAAVSFLIHTEKITWQAGLISLAAGAAVASYDVASFYAESSGNTPPKSKWEFSLLLLLGPAIIVMLSVNHELPRYYAAAGIMLFLASNLITSFRNGTRKFKEIRRYTSGVSWGFVAIILVCRLYETYR